MRSTSLRSWRAKMSKPKVLASVITFNRKDLLARCLKALKAQTYKLDAILVVDNNSSDGTEEMLRKKFPEIKYIKHKKNLGGSGGQYSAMNYAVKNKYDYLWTMDDDGFSDPSALKKLMESPHLSKGGILNSLVISEKNHNELCFGVPTKNGVIKKISQLKKLKEVSYAFPCNCTLIGTDVLKKIGFMKKDLFIWGDDLEYYYRAKNYNIPMNLVLDSRCFHPASADNLFKSDMPIDSFWKIYFLVRNMRFYQKRKFGLIFPLVNFGMFINIIIKILLTQKTYVKNKLKLVLIAYFHSLSNNLSKDIVYARQICYEK